MRRNLFIIAAVLFTGVLSVSCSKENLGVETVDQEKQGPQGQVENVQRLVSGNLTGSVQADEGLAAAIEKTKALLGDASFVQTIRDLASDLKSSAFCCSDWKIKTYRIVYRTVDGNGDEILLSGDIGFIGDDSGKVQRELSTVTLFHTMLNLDDNDENLLNTTMAYRDPLIACRSFYNALVVYPHYQGAGVDKGKHPFSMSAPLLKARQAIDCELAALEFLKTLDNVEMAEDYYTENIGVSNGAISSLATQYLLENDSEMREKADIIRLNGTYVGEACYHNTDLFVSLISKAEEEETSLLGGLFDFSLVEKTMPYMVMATALGVFDAYPTIFKSRGVDSVEDMFSPKFLNLKVDYKGTEMRFLDYYKSGNMDTAFDTTMGDNGITPRIVLHPEMFLISGDLNWEDRKLQAILTALDESEVLCDGWDPASPLLIRHSMSDDFLSYDEAYEVYRNLSVDGANKNVEIKPVYVLDHITSALYEFVTDVLFTKHPANQ